MEKAKKTKVELAVIEKVTEMRIKKGLSQYDLSVIIGVNKSFISHVESPQFPSKYNLNHLNRLASSFSCSIHELIPAKPIKEPFWDE